MISISKLYGSLDSAGDSLRYRSGGKPVAVFNCTRRCNLFCKHCYSSSTDQADENELTTAEAYELIDDLAQFGAPVILFSGGEPLMRGDILQLIAHASAAGLRSALSTNGTLIDAGMAGKLAQAGLGYAGVSLDGMEQTNDAFRGKKGAFRQALAGIGYCRQAGIKVGLRMTLHRANVADLADIFSLVEDQQIDRVCFYHLVCTGRGENIRTESLTHSQTRDVLDTIMDLTSQSLGNGHEIEVLTVNNHADGPYVYMRLARENQALAQRCLELLRASGGNSSGSGIAAVNWNGDVLADQFWANSVLGNVRRTPFSRIWSDPHQPLLVKLRSREKYLNPRCSRCRWLDVCNGNFRARAEIATGDCWGEDPACYLTDEEIAP